nr:hypothetical protein BaRGS_010775 [Batillaria attramentaria]
MKFLMQNRTSPTSGRPVSSKILSRMASNLGAWRVVLDAGFLRVCPIQPHFLRRICLATGSCPARSHSPSFRIFSGHLMLKMRLRQFYAFFASSVENKSFLNFRAVIFSEIYGYTTKTMQQKIQTFFNTCLRRIFNIRWPEKIRNEELWERAGQEPVAKQILRRKSQQTTVE